MADDMFNPIILTVEGINRSPSEDLVKPLACGCLPLRHVVRFGVSLEVLRLFVDRAPEAFAIPTNKHGNIALSSVGSRTPPDVAMLVAECTPREALLLLDGDGDLPLHCLIQNRAGDPVLRLTIERCDPAVFATASKLGRLPLHEALRVNSTSPQIVQMLLERTPHDALMTPDNEGFLPIHAMFALPPRSAATQELSLPVVELLVRHSPPDVLKQVNKDGRLPLHCALASGASPKVCSFLVDASPVECLSLADKNGKLPIHLVLGSPVTHVENVELLLRRSPAVAFATVDENGMLPLHFLRSLPSVSFKETRAVLVARSPPESFLQRDNQGRLPLHAALEGKTIPIDLLRLLMHVPNSQSAAATTRDILFTADDEGRLPLHTALLHDAGLGVIQLLLNAVGPQLAESMLATTDKKGRLPVHCLATRPGRWVCGALWKALLGQSPRVLLLVADKDGRLPLHTAALHFSGVNSHLSYLASHVDARHADYMLAKVDKEGRSPLHCLLQSYGSICSRYLVNLLMGPPPHRALSIADINGALPLHTALLNDANLEVIQRSVECSPAHALSTADNMGRVPLACAVACGFEVFQHLLDRTPPQVYAMPDKDGKLLLHHIASLDVAVATLLVERFPEMLLVPDKVGKLPIHYAIEHSTSLGKVTILVERCPEALLVADQKGRLPVHMMTKQNRIVTRWLISRSGTEALLAADNDLRLPLHWAILDNWPNHLVKELVVRCPEAMLRFDKDGHLPLYHALVPSNSRSHQRQQMEIVQLLIKHSPPSLSTVDRLGRLPLHDALDLRAQLPVVELLIKFYPEAARHADHEGRLPLYHALEKQLPFDAIQVVLNAFPGAAIWQDKANHLPLHTAALASVQLDTIFTLARLAPELLEDVTSRTREGDEQSG